MKIYYQNERDEIKFVFKVVWGVITAALLATLVMPFILETSQVYAIAPVCLSKKLYHTECALCGMTTSFIYISGGQFRQAVESNGFSLYLYSVFALDVLTYLALLSMNKNFLLRYFKYKTEGSC